MKRALVTGGNRGVGKAISSGLVAEGLDVVIGSRDAAAGTEAASELGCRSVQLDVADDDSIAALDGDFDILVNNAGVYWDEALFDDPSHFDESLDVMLRAPFRLIRQCLPNMKGAGYGRIVNVSSGWGSFSEGLGGGGGYAVAKAALNALTLIADRDTPDSIKINAVCPGWVRTRMGGPGARWSPEEGAESAIWLATLPDDGPSGGLFRRREPVAW